jgi:hypothetical protein
MAAGRQPAFTAATLSYLDGWLNPGDVADTPHYIIVRAVDGPAARAFVPTAANGTLPAW